MSLATTKTSTYRWSARAAGLLFIIGTAAGMLSVGLTGDLFGTDYLVKLAANENMVLAGAFLVLVMAVACASIAIALYPVLRLYSESLALGAIGFRLIEAMLQIGIVISFFMLLALSQEFVKTGSLDSASLQAVGTVILAGQAWVHNAGMLVAWCIGALMYYYIFYQAKLVPRWLSAWGVAGIVLALTSCLLYLFQVIGPDSPVQSLLCLPIALQEMVFAIWLIVRGYDPAALQAMTKLEAVVTTKRS